MQSRNYLVVLIFFVLMSVGELRAQAGDNFSAMLASMSQSPRKSMEVGVGIGATYMHTSASADGVSLSPHMGVRASLSMSLCWVDAYALQMEVAYLYNKIDAQLSGSGREFEVGSNIVELPLIFSYRGLGIVRLNVGGVFSLAGTARYDLVDGSERIEFGRVRPTLGYLVGAGVELTPHLVVDLRYVGSPSRQSNYFEGIEFQSRSGWAMIGLEYKF